MPPLATHLLRDLLVDPQMHPRGLRHLSSASGLVMRDGRFYVVADDEQHLALFESDASIPVTLIRLFEGDLPDKKSARKALKADLEVLVSIVPDPRWPEYPHGALLALGSGSRRSTRERGVLLTLAPNGSIVARKSLDLSDWYAPLRDEFADLNIEGAMISGESFWLMHRANRGDSRNGCIEYRWPDLMRWLAGNTPEPPPALRTSFIDLGEIDGVPLGVTDAAAVTDEIWAVSAVAENTDNSFADGPCLASAIALIDRENRVLAIHPLAGSPKVEGLVASVVAGGVSFLMVTDADNPSIASQMRTASVVLPA